jgi:hypothetical protein
MTAQLKQKASATLKKFSRPGAAMLLVSGLACGLCAITEAFAFAFALAGGRAGFGVALAGEAVASAPAAAVVAATHSAALAHDRLLSVMVMDYTASSEVARVEC